MDSAVATAWDQGNRWPQLAGDANFSGLVVNPMTGCPGRSPPRMIHNARPMPPETEQRANRGALLHPLPVLSTAPMHGGHTQPSRHTFSSGARLLILGHGDSRPPRCIRGRWRFAPCSDRWACRFLGEKRLVAIGHQAPALGATNRRPEIGFSRRQERACGGISGVLRAGSRGSPTAREVTPSAQGLHHRAPSWGPGRPGTTLSGSWPERC